jgi:hypothetical protein
MPVRWLLFRAIVEYNPSALGKTHLRENDNSKNSRNDNNSDNSNVKNLLSAAVLKIAAASPLLLLSKPYREVQRRG